jgi:hypothetical protein
MILFWDGNFSEIEEIGRGGYTTVFVLNAKYKESKNRIMKR